DAYCKNVESGKANEADKRAWERAVTSSQGEVARAKLPVSFRLLSSATDITEGNMEQMLNIIADQVPGVPKDQVELKTQLEPRLTCAMKWSQQYVPEDERTHVQHAFDPEVYASLDDKYK